MTTRDNMDFESLLDLARDRSVEGRTHLVRIVGDLFFDTENVISDRERALMTEILRQLIHDVEMSVRRALAERLAKEPDAPPDLVRMLADDEIEVAHPILIHSPVLQDPDLIEIVHHRTMQHRLAVAMRESLSETVSEALADSGNVDVIKQLLENANAEISRRTMEYLVEESKRVDVYQNPLVHRRDLPPALAKRMYWWVSSALRAHILEHFDVDPTELEEHFGDTVSDLIADDAAAAEARKVAELAKQLKQTKAISPTLLVQALRQGEIALFEEMMAELTRLDVALVRRLIHEPGGESLAIACKGIGIDKPEFASIFLFSRSARPGDKIVDPDEVPTVMRFYDRIGEDSAQRVLRRWRLDPDFLFAMRQVGGG